MKNFRKYLLHLLLLATMASALSGCVMVPVPVEPWHHHHYDRW